MGSYSYIRQDDVHLVDADGFKEFANDIFDGKNPNYKDSNMLDGIGITKDTLDNLKNEDQISFQDMDGWKIISYWYQDFVMFLRDLAVFVDGEVSFIFETDEEFANITFNDGDVKIKIGEVIFKDVPVMDLLMNRHYSDDSKDAPEMDSKTMGRLLLRRL
jgi:hypothetical protein